MNSYNIYNWLSDVKWISKKFHLSPHLLLGCHIFCIDKKKFSFYKQRALLEKLNTSSKRELVGVKALGGGEEQPPCKHTATYSVTFYLISLLQKEICLYPVCKVWLGGFFFSISWIVVCV